MVDGPPTRAEVCATAIADCFAGDGEILARGPGNTVGYLGLPDLTAELIDAGGWLHTGVIGSIDADGFVSVTDRKKELIKIGRAHV